jgi:hypothetical protein
MPAALLDPIVIGAILTGVASIFAVLPGVIRAWRETPNGHQSPRRLLERLVAAIRGKHGDVWDDLDEGLRTDIDRELDS